MSTCLFLFVGGGGRGQEINKPIMLPFRQFGHISVITPLSVAVERVGKIVGRLIVSVFLVNEHDLVLL